MVSTKKLSASAQMLLVAGISELLSLVTLALALFANIGSPTTTMATFLVCIVTSLICAVLAGILALVGLIKYKSHQLGFIVIIVLSILCNPAIWLGLVALAG